ncbi:hypothetical protein LCGC14_1001710 [marine sediment metagenome]|uniref:RmlD-like substrate binding domain-containing protein n=1 Tax=marine sediment metagenome TaxID=412755 RepID=A0A0F9NPC4_9ZZZZ
MKQIMVLGSSGMAGHTIYNYLSSLNKYRVFDASRTIINKKTILIDVENQMELSKFITYDLFKRKIDIVINCIGLLVKDCEENPAKASYINSYFPHLLELVTKKSNIKIVHLSTDCVFSGNNGNYFDFENPDAIDFYGKSKALGEINNNKDLTIRMSIIGRELKKNGTGLFEWFMRQTGRVRGYTNAIWSGITTLELAKAIEQIIDSPFNLTGLYQLAPNYSISKFDLLNLINKVWERKDIKIIPDYIKSIDKSLINTYHTKFTYNFPESYEQMLKEYRAYLNE